MAEAVFTISAEIIPQLDDKAVQRQAQQLATQLNTILAKNIQPINAAPATGSFRPFEQEIVRTRNAFQTFTRDLGTKVPGALKNIARTGKGAFLKFTDAVDITRRDIVGFNGSIVDTIKNTRLFESALEGIKDTGSSIGDLPGRFEELAASVRSGTSALDIAALNGDRLAQAFQPIQRQGEAARTEFVELNRSIDTLTLAVGRLAASSGNLDELTREVGKDPFQKQIESARDLQNILKGTPNLFADVKGSLDKAALSNSPDVLLKELTDIKNRAQEITGPLGRIAQFVNEKSGGRFFKENTKAARELAIELEQGAISKIREFFGPGVLGPMENFNARLRAVRDTVKGVINALNGFRTGIANVLPGTSPIGILTHSLSESITNFKILKLEGLSSLDALKGAIKETFRQFNENFHTKNPELFKFITGVKSEIGGLAATFATTKIGQKFGEATAQLGNFLNKNLIDPLRRARGQIRQAASEVGADFTNGLGGGITSGQAKVEQASKSTAIKALQALKNELKTHSDSKVTYKDGQDVASGLQHGIQSGQGKVNAAMSALGSGLSTLTQQVAQFASSAAAVGGTVLAGLGAKALLAGKEFNVLKQVVNATIPVLVGSKEAAAGLLAEVNELNNTSPFARSTFLELTRVLAGFGVQAAKITPLIDAIQQTVAATGGSDQDILELGQAFAKLQSQGRVTGEILQSFSIRGVDAVAVLAKGFETTTSEMRKMISDGLVPANKAIDILTKGLKEKFDGATDAVAKNFPGALQRVEARLRDIGGTLLTAFINPAGGGALVDFLNNMADLLSHINKVVLPEFAPLLQKAADALVVLSEKVEKVVKSFDRFDAQNFIEKLKPWAPVLAALAGLFPLAFGFIPVIGPIIAGLGGPLTAVAAALGVLLIQSGKTKEVMGGASDAISGFQANLEPAVGFIKDNAVGTMALLASSVDKTGKTVAVGVNAVSKGISGFGKGVAATAGIVPVVGKVGGVFSFLTGIVAKFVSFFGKVAPVIAKILPQTGKLAAGLKFLTGPIGLVISILAQVILTSQKFRDGLKRLFEALKPVAAVIVGVFVVAIKIMDEAIKALEPVFVIVVNLLALLFEKLNLVIKPVADFIKKLQEAGVIEKVFKGIKQGIITAIDFVVDAINILIKAYNAIPFLDNVEEIKFTFEADTDPLKKAAADAKKALEEQQKAAEKSAAAIEDAFNAANKAVESAEKAMGDANDQLIQAVNTAAGVIQGIISASKAVQTAQAAIADARTKASEATQEVRDLEKEYARALEDTIKPADELGVAERNLTRIRKGLIDLTREEINIAKENAKLQKELADLQGEEANEDRAALARSEERAQIALNRAKQAEIDLLNELNPKQKVSLNLAGLTLDQIRTRLRTARLANSATKKEREKTPQEIEDLKKSASLDVEDARAGVDSAQEARAQFEIDTNEKINDIKDQIRDNDERIKEIGDDRADQLLDEQDALKAITRLREGENALAKVTLDYTKQINEAVATQKTATEAIKTATQAAQIAQAEYAVKVAEASGNADALFKAQTNLNNLLKEGSGLNFNAGVLRDIMGEQLKNVQLARDAAREMKEEFAKASTELAKITAVQGLGTALGGFEAVSASFDRATETGKEGVADRIFPKIDPAKNATIQALRAALDSGAALQKNNQFKPWDPSPSQIEQVIARVLQLALKMTLRDAMAQALGQFNLSLTGIAAAKGLSPGMIHRGMNDGKGLVRMFEFGKEAVLPLTRPSDMKRIVNDPSVLGPILAALNIPGFASGTTGDIDSARAALLERVRRLRENILQTEMKTEESMEAQVRALQMMRERARAAEAAITTNNAAQSELALNQERIRMDSEKAAESMRQQWIVTNELNFALATTRSILSEIGGKAGSVNDALTSPDSKLRVILQEIFKKLGLQFPGFSTGYAPGDLVHSGLHDGVGMARMFEFGKEAVLPLTRPFDLARVIRNPSVLPAVLNALPRWSRPETTLDSGTVNDLANVVRSGRMGGGPANRDVYEKKAQREFASTIGDAVKIAVKEAILESDGLQGDDIDINVGATASETQRMIAREVKRQLDKRTGKW